MYHQKTGGSPTRCGSWSWPWKLDELRRRLGATPTPAAEGGELLARKEGSTSGVLAVVSCHGTLVGGQQQQLVACQAMSVGETRCLTHICVVTAMCRSQKTATTGDGATKADEFTVTFTLQGSSVAQIDGFIAAAYESYREIIKGQKPQAGEEKRWGGCLEAIASWTASMRVSLPACLHGARFYCACLALQHEASNFAMCCAV